MINRLISLVWGIISKKILWIFLIMYIYNNVVGVRLVVILYHIKATIYINSYVLPITAITFIFVFTFWITIYRKRWILI